MPQYKHPMLDDSNRYTQGLNTAPYTPTADQEALQEPRIDPVYLAAGALTGGASNVIDALSVKKGLINYLASLGEPDPSNFTRYFEAEDAIKATPWFPGLAKIGKEFGKGAIDATQSGIIGQEMIPGSTGKVGGLPIGKSATKAVDPLINFIRANYAKAPMS